MTQIPRTIGQVQVPGVGLEAQVVDLPEGGDVYLDAANAAVVAPRRALTVPPGSMLMVIPPEIAAHLRAQLKPQRTPPPS